MHDISHARLASAYDHALRATNGDTEAAERCLGAALRIVLLRETGDDAVAQAYLDLIGEPAAYAATPKRREGVGHVSAA